MRKNSSKRDFNDYLSDIDFAIETIEKFIEGLNFEKFSDDIKTQDAVIRRFEIIGEATKNIPQRFKNKNKEIPWKKMAGMRDKLTHEYFGVNKKVVWRTIKEDIPELKAKLSELLKEIKINRLI